MKPSLIDLWKNRELILQGIKYSFIKSEHVEQLAAERKAICDTCPLIDLEGSKCFMPGTSPCCGECGCSLKFKTRSMASECPHPDGPKWKAIISQDEEDKFYDDIGFDPNE